MGSKRTATLWSALWLLDSAFLVVSGLTLFFSPQSVSDSNARTLRLLGASISALGGLLFLLGSELNEQSHSSRFAINVCFLLFHSQAASVQHGHNFVSTTFHINFAVYWLWSLISHTSELKFGARKALMGVVILVAFAFTTRTTAALVAAM